MVERPFSPSPCAMSGESNLTKLAKESNQDKYRIRKPNMLFSNINYTYFEPQFFQHKNKQTKLEIQL